MSEVRLIWPALRIVFGAFFCWMGLWAMGSVFGLSTPPDQPTQDWKKLAEAGDFDSNYLHLKSDEPALA